MTRSFVGALLVCTVLAVNGLAADDQLAASLKNLDTAIVYESYQDNNWDLYIARADGSQATNLTRTPGVNELYPHVSPDGSRISFLVDEGEDAAKSRNLYLMNIDGTGRTLVARNARDQCWNAAGTAIAYLKGEFEEYCAKDFATKEIVFYDLKTGRHTDHPNKDICHLYNLCWAPDGGWLVATVHGGMGFTHAILAIEAQGMKVVDLKLPGCRPDISPDGKKIVWTNHSHWICTADVDFSLPEPKASDLREVVTSVKPIKAHHADWSPDGRYLAFARGPAAKGLGLPESLVGSKAKGWNICVADAGTKDRWIALTSDGHSHKEPDWAPAGTWERVHGK